MRLALLVGTLLGPLLAAAEPPPPSALPQSLRDWTGWVLHDEPEAACPFLEGGQQRQCTWPSRLSLALEPRGGRFEQSARAFRAAWMALPGSAKRWPQSVRVDGRGAVVVARAIGGVERPAVRLEPGEHAVAGAFEWDALPEAIEVPPETGLVALAVGGRAVPRPERDDDGRLYLRRERPAEETERLELIAHRMIVDEVPLGLTTRLTLNVSGKSRELLLGRALPDGFVPLSLEAELPARLEPDGHLRIQVRPGHWVITLAARSEGPVTSLARPKPDGLWPEGDEAWAFDARPSLRQVLVEGVASIDPKQTTLPAEWQQLPAYAVGLEAVMTLTERRRGDAEPPPDALQLMRRFWLDFSGNGYTVSDRITGTLHRSTRLEMSPRTELGRVVAAGADQSITRLSAAAPAGVELHKGQLSLEADSRIEGSAGTLPAVSWDADFNAVSASLEIPPGWTLWHVGGADHVPGTWLDRWTLADLFLVLVAAFATSKLFGRKWGLVAGLALALAWHEDGVPRFAWLTVLAGEAMVRVLPAGALRTLARVGRFVAWAVLAILVITFAVSHLRRGMYPSLELGDRALGEVQSYSDYATQNSKRYESGSELFSESAPGDGGGESDLDRFADLVVPDKRSAASSNALSGRAASAPRASGKPGAGGATAAQLLRAQDVDRNATVQTGPGLPSWSWKRVSIQFSGPVSRDQQVRLFWTGPAFGLWLNLARVALLGLLLVRVLRGPSRPGQSPDGTQTTDPAAPPDLPASVARTAAITAALLLLAPGYARAQTPDAATLAQLKERLLERPDCAPNCASASRLMLEATPSTLRLRLEVLAAAPTAVALPGQPKQWSPESVVVDGRPASSLRRMDRGTLWLALDAGVHQVVLEGVLPERDTVQLELPLRPHRVESKLDGWTLSGVHEDGLADEALQLSRVQNVEQRQTSLGSGSMPAFVRVERTLSLGLQWTVETRVVRLSPVGASVALEVPLLEGESVTTGELRVQDRRVLVNLAPQATETSWSSVLEARPRLELAAPQTTTWLEQWRVDTAPMWHLETSGIPEIHQPGDDARVPEWRPWPGEKVVLELTRPEGVAGPTLTIDQSSLVVSPGARATDATLSANLRASRGMQHAFTLPEGAELQSVKVNEEVQPIRQEGRAVSIPLGPGSSSVELAWRESQGMNSSWRTPTASLGVPGSNVQVQVRVPSDRWVLFVWGPPMGPAVLFWSFLAVLLVVAAVLARTGLTPLTTAGWLLLSIGLSQTPALAVATVFGWLLLAGWRRATPDVSRFWFNLRQLALVGLTPIVLGIIVVAVYGGLLGQPRMQVEGNGSNAFLLRWFQDRAGAELPSALVISVPMVVYRIAMLLWSLWMANALLGWLKWIWQAFSAGGLWHHGTPPRPRPAPPAPTSPPATPPKSA